MTIDLENIQSHMSDIIARGGLIDTTYGLISEIKRLRSENRSIRKQKEILMEALEFMCRPEKLGEQGYPWFYRKNAGEEALSRVSRMEKGDE